MNKNIISQLFLYILTMCTIISCKDNINVSCKQESYTAEDSIAVINVSYKTLLSQNKDLNLWFQRINDSLSTKFKASADTVREMSKEDRKFLREDFPPYSFYVKDSTFNLSDKLVSERYTVYTYSGGAHGYTYFISLNLLPDTRMVSAILSFGISRISANSSGDGIRSFSCSNLDRALLILLSEPT